MRGLHPIAPSAEAVGRELVDTGAVELPVGHSADRTYDAQLTHGDKTPEPDTTGATLHDDQSMDFGAGMHEVDDVRLGEESPEADTEITARPSHILHDDVEESYDAMAPEDRGVEWLSRATQAPRHHEPEWEDLERELDTSFLQSATSAPVMSEASRWGAFESEVLDRMIDGEPVETPETSETPLERAPPPPPRARRRSRPAARP